MLRDRSTNMHDERIGLAKLIRNGTTILSAAFLTASLGFHYVASLNDNEVKSLPPIVQTVKQQDTSGTQIFLAGFGVLVGAIAGAAQIGLRKASTEANNNDFRP